MAKKSKIAKALKHKPKFSVRIKHICTLCGRPRGYIRKTATCRICFREQATKGNLPGFTKASW